LSSWSANGIEDHDHWSSTIGTLVPHCHEVSMVLPYTVGDAVTTAAVGDDTLALVDHACPEHGATQASQHRVT